MRKKIKITAFIAAVLFIISMTMLLYSCSPAKNAETNTYNPENANDTENKQYILLMPAPILVK
ncbi:MAG: hypothetical protein FWF92_00760 [Oscillospiraceae bacterium]|nr:hypothetical protein [Oscillospiraceae bacterium]